ncbi:hypothetical protein JCM31185_08560 [Furfurilactobacillus curtus]|uniref:Uncharacterized protein n=1 Tax=Furfurilactobacillus curtus TaxID=1746200 RepID=A0ABQ5JM41_9LACO
MSLLAGDVLTELVGCVAVVDVVVDESVELVVDVTGFAGTTVGVVVADGTLTTEEE